MAFDPKKHLIQLKGKWYLETRYRIMWFRSDGEHPDGRISTEIVSLDPLYVKATVCDKDGMVLATGHGGAVDKGNAVWSGRALEKAESAAIGRALGHAGYGTQFLASEGDNLADSPVERRQPPRQQSPRPNSQPPANSVLDTAAANGGTVTRRETKESPDKDPQDDLTNRDTAADFLKATRAAGISDNDVLAALNVKKLSEWKHGRKAAGQRVKEWQAKQPAA